MTITVGGTAITFNDGSTQSTAAGGIPAFGAVGCTAVLAYYNTSTGLIPGNTIAGSSLYYPTTISSYALNGVLLSEGNAASYPYSYYNNTGSGIKYQGGGAGAGAPPGGSTTLSGTWRALGPCPRTHTINGCSERYTLSSGVLAVRIA